MQGVEGRGLLRHCSEELKIQDAPNEPADAAGGKEDHDKSRFFFGAQYSTYATKKKLIQLAVHQSVTFRDHS